MSETTATERFRYACGKCRSQALYREDDPAVGDCCICCPICGNRYYGDVGRVGVGSTAARVGVAPVKVHYTPEPLERTANLSPGTMRRGNGNFPKVEGPSHKLPRVAPDPAVMKGSKTAKVEGNLQNKEEIMGMRKACANCGRVMSVAGEGCCYVCYHAAKGLVGEKKDKARAAIKTKIENGGLNVGRRTGPQKAAPAGLAVAPGGAAAAPETSTVKAPAMPPAPEGAKAPPASAPMSDADVARAAKDNLAIFIGFQDERDHILYDAITEKARSLRRTPEQQILWMLQEAIEKEAAA